MQTDENKISFNLGTLKHFINNSPGLSYEENKITVDSNYNSCENMKCIEDEGLDGYCPSASQAQKFNDKEQTINQDDYEYDWKRDEIVVNEIRLMYYATWKQGDKGKRRIYRSKDGKITKKVSEPFEARLHMKEKMETEKGKQIYGLRKTIVEPVIGNIKYNLRFEEFLIRGLDGAKLELNIARLPII